MQPFIWGRHLWRACHYIALGFPSDADDTVRQQYKDFFLNLWKVVPCLKCGVNYQRHLTELPPIDGFLSSNMELFKWTVALHNLVNLELGKPQMQFEEALKLFSADIVDTEQPVHAPSQYTSPPSQYPQFTSYSIPAPYTPAPSPSPIGPLVIKDVLHNDPYSLPKNIMIITLVLIILFLIVFIVFQKKHTTK